MSRPRWLSILALLLFPLPTTARPRAPQQGCTPGRSAPCACPGGASGEQLCGDGRSYDECSCVDNTPVDLPTNVGCKPVGAWKLKLSWNGPKCDDKQIDEAELRIVHDIRGRLVVDDRSNVVRVFKSNLQLRDEGGSCVATIAQDVDQFGGYAGGGYSESDRYYYSLEESGGAITGRGKFEKIVENERRCVSDFRVLGTKAPLSTPAPAKQGGIGVVPGMERLRATGPIGPDEATIAAVRTSSNYSAVIGCYERALKRDPSLHGTVEVQFTISATGRITRADIVQDSLRDDEVASCITGTVRSWRLPRHDGGDVAMSWPFVFRTSK